MDVNPLLDLYENSQAANQDERRNGISDRPEKLYKNSETILGASLYQPNLDMETLLVGEEMERNAIPDEGVLHLRRGVL